MDKEFIRKFLDLVDSSAPIKAYTKGLGLTVGQYRAHLAKCDEYRVALAAPEPKPEPKPAPKPKTFTAKLQSRLKAKPKKEADDKAE